MGMRVALVDRAEETDTSAAKRDVSPLPKRTTAASDRAPVLMEASPEVTGSAMTVPGDPSYATVMRRRLRTLASLPDWEIRPVALLASEASRHITGQAIAVDGGAILL